MFPQISDADWDVYNEDDVMSIVLTQILSKAPHISVPIPPFTETQKILDLLTLVKRNLIHWQDYIPIMNPHMNFKSQKALSIYFANDPNCIGIMLTGRTPTQLTNLRSYQLFSEDIPDDKLLFAVDVEDRFGGQGLPTQMAFRCLNFDVSCKQVKVSLTRKVYDDTIKRKIYDIFVYIDQVAGLLNEQEQMKWTGKSLSKLLTDKYSLEIGVNYPELAKAFNFAALNQTGKIEVKHIMEKTHQKYIEKRPYLEAFVNTLVQRS